MRYLSFLFIVFILSCAKVEDPSTKSVEIFLRIEKTFNQRVFYGNKVFMRSGAYWIIQDSIIYILDGFDYEKPESLKFVDTSESYNKNSKTIKKAQDFYQLIRDYSQLGPAVLIGDSINKSAFLFYSKEIALAFCEHKLKEFPDYFPKDTSKYRWLDNNWCYFQPNWIPYIE